MSGGALDREAMIRRVCELTPGGSEFHNDFDACLRWVSDRLKSAGSVAKERNELRARVAELEAERDRLRGSLEKMLYHFGFTDGEIKEQGAFLNKELVKIVKQARAALASR